MVLIDFHGAIRDRAVLRHDWPEPDAARAFALAAAQELVQRLPEPDRTRVAGLGIAQPFLLGLVRSDLGSQAVMDQWRNCDLRADLGRPLPYPVFLRNDASAACGADLAFGKQSLPRDFVYFYIGFFIGGVVLNGALHTGDNVNLGALRSMPVRAPEGRMVQLIDLTSIIGLERKLVSQGLDLDLLWKDAQDWPVPEHLIADWIDTAAQAIVSCLPVVDFRAVVMIDGSRLPSADDGTHAGRTGRTEFRRPRTADDPGSQPGERCARSWCGCPAPDRPVLARFAQPGGAQEN